MAASKRLGKYEILEEIGRGGFAVVYKARDTTLNRVVALKVLHPQLTIDPKFVRRFHQEARTAAQIHHPHVVTIYEVGQEAGQHYLAMAFLPGSTLDKQIDEGPLPAEQAVSIVEQIADALDAVHRRELVHRDVKPANIMVDSQGRATLLDFGIVRAIEGTRLTTAMTVLGTPEYMAPEQAELEGAAGIDWRADIYALGVVAYEMLVGRPPFIGASPTAVLYQHVHEPPPEPCAINPDIPAELQPVLLKALAKEREDRFQQANTFAAELRRVLLADSQIQVREERLTPLYEQMRTAVEEEEWADVLALGGQIQSLDAGYRDVPQLMVQARERLQRKRKPMPAWSRWAVIGGAIGILLLVLGLILAPRLFGPSAPGDIPTVMSLEALPIPFTERVTAAGTWTVFSGSNAVLDMTFRDGLLWVATTGGVVVWDTERGTHIKYTTLDGLSSNYIEAIAVGPDNDLWFGTGGYAPTRYDPSTGSWRTFTTDDGFVGDAVSAIAVGPDGDLWFGTLNGGVSCYDPDTKVWKTFTTEDGLAGDDVFAIAVGSDDTLWFGTNDGVSRYTLHSDTWQTFTTEDGLPDNDVHAIAIEPDGSLWFRTSFDAESGVSRYDPSTDTWQSFTPREGLDGVLDIAVGPDGAVWFGTWEGVSRYDPATGSWRTFTTQDGLANNYVLAITLGPGGDLWFGTSVGVSRYDSNTDTWQSFIIKDKLVDSNVQDIAVGSDGAIWFGTREFGVSRYDPSIGDWQTFTTDDGLVSNEVRSVAAGPAGTVWFGAWGAGVTRYEPGSWCLFTTDDGLIDGDVQAIAVGPDGLAWFGTRSGVSRYSPFTDSWQAFTTENGLASNDVRAIAVEPDGILWFGTPDGVSRYDPSTDTWQTFTATDGLAHNAVLDIAVGLNGDLWFCFGETESGVSRYDPSTDAWQTFTTKDGLANNNVWTIAVGPDGDLWFGTLDSGVSYYNPNTDTWQTFTTDDGLSYNDVRTVAVESNGALWFGTLDGGVTRFEPASP